MPSGDFQNSPAPQIRVVAKQQGLVNNYEYGEKKRTFFIIVELALLSSRELCHETKRMLLVYQAAKK